MRNFWAKLILLAIVAFAFTLPAWAVDLNLSGYYEIQGRYYKEADIQSKKIADDTDVTDQYLKHYFHILPTLAVTDKISIKADLCAFENKISKDDHVQWYGESGTSDAQPYDENNVFRIDELYATIITDYGMFRAGKTADFSGIAYFIQVPSLKGWTFGLVWDKVNEDNTDMDATHDNADKDNFALKALYANDTLDFDGTIAYKHTDHEVSSTGIIFPYFYLNYQVADNLKLYSKFAYATGTLVDKKSPSAKGVVAATDAAIPLGGALIATYTPVNKGGYFMKDAEVDSVFGFFVGAEYGIDTITLRGDVAYAPGADKPQYVSGYFEDDEDFGTWLMNDVSDAWATTVETPATTAALDDPYVEGNYSFANIILVRARVSSQFTDKLGGWLNLAWAKKANTDYLEKWDISKSWLNVIDPVAMKAGGTGMLGGAIPSASLTQKVDDCLGWEVHAGLDYALQDNLTVGVDGCYYAPGDFYESLLEKGFEVGGITGLEVEDAYALRWTAKVAF